MSKAVLAFAISWVLGAASTVYAQSKPLDQQTNGHPGGSVVQPQGTTGPITTKSGGAQAESPQGDTPAGMQANPTGPTSKDQSDKVKKGTSKN
jgi:hypothetical protein